MPAAHAYGIYNLQMKRYSRACGSYQDFGIEDTVNTEATETRVPVGKGTEGYVYSDPLVAPVVLI
jgi:hypothetical protein